MIDRLVRSLAEALDGITDGSTGLVCGFDVAGAQVGVDAIASAYRPAASRATGLSWAYDVGRIGAVLRPIVGRFLLWLVWDPSTVLGGAAFLACVAGATMPAE